MSIMVKGWYRLMIIIPLIALLIYRVYIEDVVNADVSWAMGLCCGILIGINICEFLYKGMLLKEKEQWETDRNMYEQEYRDKYE